MPMSVIAVDDQVKTDVNEWPVILEADLSTINALALVLFELKLEGMLVKEELQLLVSEVNADLLKAVRLEVFKTEDIKDTCSVYEQD